ncbi:MAG: porin [Burkholderiaceae bacterium]
MKVLKSLRMTPVALALVMVGAQAQSNDSMFSFSGFGTVGVVGTSKDGAEYVIPGQMRGADKDWSGEVDSKLGLQGTAKFNAIFSGTVQVLTKQNGKGNWAPEIEWAFAKYQATPGLSFRAGRMGAPFFAVSDFRDVGYANTWLRPPIDVYGQVTFSHFDGADVNWTTTIAGKTVTLQALGGASESHVRNIKLKLKDQVGFNATAELADGLTVRVGHMMGKVTVEQPSVNALVGVLRQTPFAAVGNELIADGKDATFSGIGLNYDEGQWIAAVEYTKRKTDSFVPDTTGWYATLGYRVGKFTPYGTVSQLKTDSSNVNNTIPGTVVVAGLPLRALVDRVTTTQSTPQKTVGLGVRWDAWRNVAVKAQYDSIKTTGAGQFTQVQPGFNNERVGVYSVAVDFVF